jgi:glycogen operon protein
VTLLLYAAGDPERPLHQVRLDPRLHKTGPVWHCLLEAGEVEAARWYAYRVEGPDDPAAGQRFQPEKLLLDPYAGDVEFPPGFSREAAMHPGDNAGKAPLGVIAASITRSGPPPGPPSRPPAPRHAASELVIYELHVKGFTRHPPSGVTEERRGTFAGLVDKIPYLQDLGVTAVELLPVFQYDPQEGNYWGYMPLSFFAAHRGYASGTAEGPGAAADELGATVDAFHAAGIEVILDVVYNHTAEGGASGPTYSFRGLDNTAYYLLEKDRSRYRNDSGTGNVLRTAHPAVRRLIVDSMRFWAERVGVDGFRFDLATLLTRDRGGYLDADPAILGEIERLRDDFGLRLIAEPWDLASYQLGTAFPGRWWSQWNGRFRDDVRSFVRGDAGRVVDLAHRLAGSPDLFPDEPVRASRPWESVNFVTCHDGFTLYDLTAYEHKRNLANGHDNQDGSDDNRSWNCGWEGDDGAPDRVLALRKQQAKSFCALLMLANGLPMILAGDEMLNTQGGNNNPYNQDNETSWLDWGRLGEHADVHRFFRRMIAFRKAHPSIGRGRFWRQDVSWHGPAGDPDTGERSHTLALYLRGAAVGDDDLYVMINGGGQDRRFVVQDGEPGAWRRAVDTHLPSPDDIAEPGSEAVLNARDYVVRGRTVVVLVRPRG